MGSAWRIEKKLLLMLATFAFAGLGSNIHAAPALAEVPPDELQMECRKSDPEFCQGYIQAVSEGIMT